MADFKYESSSALQQSGSMLNPVRSKPGLALLSSAIVPGTGQAANNKWLRAGAYLAAEAVFFTVHLTRLNDAKQQERQYEQFANNNWSVVTYAKWLVNYYEQNNLSNSAIDELRNQVTGLSASYNTDIDWNVVDIELLRMVERNTPFIYPDRSGNNFSHVMPDYGSQQYYELISKYYQYGPGWRDFGSNQNGGSLDNPYKLNWDGTDMPFNFFRGSSLAERFNDNYRLAGNMLSLIVLNHIVSAFDAFLTVKIKNNRINAEANPLKLQSFSVKYHF
ncbi:hypothetical protein G3570_04515 [Balneolaceae bacterium YR4-1]|uniref:DUF5683 domain-containing protein n=1 Tax=Halalkalibaculum roseum TaxID=2709311 RepID=A0A6M1SXM2_9BACT|nr:hypothetical protein [Halalkalibaculum roseum]NGP75884.1 hypothetical protein [Halalkalibaculum roseum]